MDEKRPDKRLSPVSDPAKRKAAEDGGEGLDLRFANVREGKRDRLQPQGFRPKFSGVAEQDPAAEEEFPANQVQEGCPGQANRVGFVIFLHGYVTVPQIIDDRSHEENSNRSNQETCFPITEGKSKLFWIFAKDKNDYDQGDKEIKNQPIPILRRGESVIVINHQQQRAEDGDRDDFPVEVQLFTEKIFHGDQ